MKNIFYIGLAVAVSLSASAADSLNDAKAVQGNWKPVKAELAGQPMHDAVLKMISLKLDNGKYEVLVGEEPDRGTYTLDSSSEPKSMIITGTEGAVPRVKHHMANSSSVQKWYHVNRGSLIGSCMARTKAHEPNE